MSAAAHASPDSFAKGRTTGTDEGERDPFTAAGLSLFLCVRGSYPSDELHAPLDKRTETRIPVVPVVGEAMRRLARRGSNNRRQSAARLHQEREAAFFKNHKLFADETYREEVQRVQSPEERFDLVRRSYLAGRRRHVPSSWHGDEHRRGEDCLEGSDEIRAPE